MAATTQQDDSHPLAGEPAQRAEVSVSDLLNGATASLAIVEDHVVKQTEERMRKRLDEGRPFNDDWAFEYHTAYVEWAGAVGLWQRPAELWRSRLAPVVAKAETELAKKPGGGRIHKGAPLYNVGMCLFRCGAFDTAIQFIAAAGVEEKHLRRGNQSRLVVGQNSLSKQVLIAPVIGCSRFEWAEDYAAITGRQFDEGEFVSLLDWLSRRQLGDAIEAVSSPHRVMATLEAPDNDAARHVRVQALAGLILVVESSLRQWQPSSLAGKQLHGRLEDLLGANTRAAASFDRIKAGFDRRWTGSAAKETSASVNWIIRRSLSRLRSYKSVGSRAGVACFLTLRLRNSLMHLVDHDLKIYKDASLLCRLLGVMFAVIRLSQHGQEGTVAGL